MLNVLSLSISAGTVDVASIEDEAIRKATELQIARFGQCPMQLLVVPASARSPDTEEWVESLLW
jgi:hypothetical protein